MKMYKRGFLSVVVAVALSGCDSELMGLLDENSTIEQVEQNGDTLHVEENSTTIKNTIAYSDTKALGEALFNDTSLSQTRSISCATCHNPEHAFIDSRSSGDIGASLGDDNITYGDRNAPMVTYASYIPEFGVDEFASRDGQVRYKGGQFFDGRATDLVEQAKGPFLNESEMQMSDENAVVARILENSNYVESMKRLYGENIFDSSLEAFNKIAEAIADFESSPALSSFDSRYDKFRARKGGLSTQEMLGMRLFKQSNCVACHNDRARRNEPTFFTFFGYQNIGVPKNSELRNINNKGANFIDNGLSDNPNINDSNQDGRFRVPSLRNVAVSAPYMHNGKFKTLKTVVHFYNTRDVEGAINPETQLEWEPSEVLRNRSRLIGNLGLSDEEEDAIVAFLKTLTDERYESLLH